MMKNPYLLFASIWLIIWAFLYALIPFAQYWPYEPLPNWVWMLVCINVGTFILFALDKVLAGAKTTRVPERILFLASLLGGSIGGFAGMQAFRHKTKKISFQLVIALIGLLQICFVLWAIGLF